MKRTRGVTAQSLCACGHLECGQVVSDALDVFQKHLSKTRTLIDAKKGQQPKDIRVEQLERIQKEMRLFQSELRDRVKLLEKVKVDFGRSMAEFYKRELINVRGKYEKPLMRSAFDQVADPEFDGLHQRKKRRRGKQVKK